MRIAVLVGLVCCLTAGMVEAVTSAELRVAAFTPVHSRVKDTFGRAIPAYQLELGQTVCRCYQVWFNTDFLDTSGRVSGCGRSDLTVWTFGLGGKYIYPINSCIDAYGGLGVAVARSCVDNHHIGKECDTSVGLIVKSGVNISVCKRYFVDLFIDYNYQPAFHNHTDIGGFRTGIGLGCYF